MPPYVVSAEGLKQAAGEFDLASIRQLALVGEGVDSAGAAQIARLCPNLTELDLSRNAIDDGEGLASLSQLQKLRLTNNKIRSLAFVAQLPALEQLFLQGNRVDHMKEMGAMAGLSALRVLYLRNVDGSDPNPVTEHLAYRTGVTRHVPSLSNLDGERTHLEQEHSTVKAAVPQPSLPASTIPPPARWIPTAYWDGVLQPPEGVAAAPAAAFEATQRECKQLLDNASAIIDRYTGFANIKGKLQSN